MTEEKRRNKYLETDEIIREAYNDYARRFDRRPTQAQIANICGIHRKTVHLHMQGNRFFEGSGLKKAVKKRVEKEGVTEYCSSYKRIVWSYLLYGEKFAISVQDLRRHGPLKKIAASTLSNHLRTLVEEGILGRAKIKDRNTPALRWCYWKSGSRVPTQNVFPSESERIVENEDPRLAEHTKEDVGARIATLEVDIKRIQRQYTELTKTFNAKKLDGQLKNLERMRDIEQAKYDALEKEFKTWNDQETKIRRDVLK